MNQVTVLYHNDNDGFGAAFALWLTFKDAATYIPVQYSQPVPEIPSGTLILYIVDFSYSRAICEDLASKYTLHIFDHHKTAEAELKGLTYARFNAEKSGCGMVWEAMYGTTLPPILQYVQDRDLWKFELPNSKEVSLFLSTLEHDFYTWYAQYNNFSFVKEAVFVGLLLKRFMDRQIDGALRDTRIMFLHGYKVPVVNCSANISEVGNRLCGEYPDSPFSASYCDRKDIRSWSLRSVGDFDVSAVAKAFGGGGHKNAAGFSTEIGWPQITPDEFLEEFDKLAPLELKTWTCCGGIELSPDESCSFCGEAYED